MKHLATAISAALAAIGLLALGAAEELTRKAFHGDLVVLLNGTPAWYEILLDNWDGWLASATHPLGLTLYCLPVLTVAAWCRTPMLQWGIALLGGALAGLDVVALMDTLAHPNIDLKGCTACMAPVLVRMMASPILLILLMIGAGMLINHRLEEGKR